MAGLVDLPPEIIELIGGYCDRETLRLLCWASQYLMAAVRVKAYHEILLREDAASGRSAQAVSSGPRASLVRSICYSPRDPRNSRTFNNDGEICPNPEHDPSFVLSAETRHVLQSLHIFPRLEAFRFRLEPVHPGKHDWDLATWPGGAEFFGVVYDTLPLSESEEPWRRLLNESFHALTASKGAFTSLQICNPPPLEVPHNKGPFSSLRTEPWRALLRTLTTLDIQLAEAPNTGAGSMTYLAQHFPRDLNEIFLLHLDVVEHLRVAGRADAMLGSHEERQVIQWDRISMPQLRVLELEWAAVDVWLGRFLREHWAGLERVYMRWCYAHALQRWHMVTQGLLEARPDNLVEFDVVADFEDPTGERRFAGALRGATALAVNGNGDLEQELESDWTEIQKRIKINRRYRR